MTISDTGKNFAAILKKLKIKPDPDAPPAPEDRKAIADALLTGLVHGFMHWEATAAQAKMAVKRLDEAFVDANELRIALPHETARALGDRYPLAAERCVRLKATLRDLYRREHGLTLAALIDAPKREARAYLESLEGMPGYVAARLMVFHLGGHATPADWRLVDLLLDHKALPPDHADPASASAWMERQIRAADAMATAAAIQAWSDEHGQSPKHDRSASAGPVAMTELAVTPRKKAAKKAVRRAPDRAPGKPKPR